MKTKPIYTAGPWTYSTDQAVFIRNFKGAGFAQVFNSLEGPEHDEANARLIAAAPELLDALYVAFGFVESWNVENGVKDNHALVVIKAALAKATGEKV